MEIMNYTIPKPNPPFTLWALGAIVLVGLSALFLAAYSAFSQVVSPAQAFFSALLIEAGAVVEALALVRGKNMIALLGMIASLAVSCTYNYIQVSVAGAGMPWIELVMLAVGPLTSLTFLSMAAGKELSLYESRVKAWEEKRQGWADRRARKEEAKEVRNLAKDNETFQAETYQESYSDWRNLPEEDRAICAELTTDQIRQKYGVSSRTALNWYNKARSNGHHVEVSQ